jgi:hypothetical protein
VTRLQTLISFDKFLSTFSKGRGPNSASKENVLKPLSVDSFKENIFSLSD